MNAPDEQFDALPEPIIDALREIDGPAVLPDAERDLDVLSGARRHFADTARSSRKPRSFRLFIGGAAGGALAAAAMVGIVVMLGEPAAKAPSANHAPTEMMAGVDIEPGEYNNDGQLNILDAYLLAKTIDRSADLQTNLHPANDLNGDGTIDQRDVDWIANQSVALNLGEQS